MVPFNHPIPPNRPRIEGRRYTGYNELFKFNPIAISPWTRRTRRQTGRREDAFKKPPKTAPAIRPQRLLWTEQFCPDRVHIHIFGHRPQIAVAAAIHGQGLASAAEPAILILRTAIPRMAGSQRFKEAYGVSRFSVASPSRVTCCGPRRPAVRVKMRIAAAEQVPEQFVASIEPRRVGAQKSLHPGHQIPRRCFHGEMRMIGHQTAGMDLPVRLGAGLTQSVQELQAVRVILAPGFPAIPLPVRRLRATLDGKPYLRNP
jgi:hypothetical protein